MTHYDFPIPKEDEFEVLTGQLMTRVYQAKDPAQLHGRRGQTQHGIDLTVRSGDGRFIGGQSKRYVATALTKAKLSREIAAAHEVEPPLDALVIVTTTRRDAKLKAHADQALLHGKHSVFVWFWEDFVDRCREHGMLSDLLVPYPAGYHLEALAKQGVVVQVLTSGASVTPPSTASSPLQQEMSAMLTQGRAGEVVSRLAAMPALDDDLRLTLARAHYHRGEDAQALALGEGATSARLQGLVGLVRARQGDRIGARAAALRARAAATANDLPYVVALEIAGELVDARSPSYAALLAMVPPTLADEPAIRGVLGDAALAHDQYALAIEHYGFAETHDPHPSVSRRLALQAARLGLVLAAMPNGDLSLRDRADRATVEEVRDALVRESQPGLDARFQRSLLHNLGVAAALLGDSQGAVRYARQAVELAPDDASLWRRWLFVLAAYDQPLDRELVRRAPASDAAVQLMLSDLEDRGGDRAGARMRVDQALTLPGLPEDLRARLEAQRIMLDGPAGPLDLERAKALLDLTATLPVPAPAVVRLGPFLSQPALEPVVEPFFAWFAAADLAGLEDDDQLALSALLVGHGFADRLERMLDLLRRRLRLPDGRIDPTVAPLLLDVLISRGRLDEALDASTDWCEAWPRSGQARHVRTRVLIARGDLDRAYRELEASAEVTAGSAPLIQQYVQLARALGHARTARRVLRGWTLPSVRSTRDLQSLYFALAATRDPRLETLALETLRPGAGLDEIAGPLLGVTIRHLRRRQSDRVRATSVVTLRRNSGVELTYWMGETPSPVQGAARADWLGPLLDRRVGDAVALGAGPFAGETVTVAAIKQPIALLVDQAKQLGQATGALEELQGSPDELIAQMRTQLDAHREATRRRFEIASAHPLPAVAMANVFNRSPRDFSQASEHWTPKCHTGITPDLEAEDQVVKDVGRWVVDPLTICLIVETGLEPLLAAQPLSPWVTAETIKTLRDWYLQERESVRAHGSMRMREDQRLEVHEISARERRAHRAYWRRVERFVEGHCEPAPRPQDDVATRFAGHVDALDAGTVSTLAAAAAYGAGVLSDELAIRAIATADGLRAASLRGLAAQALHDGRLPALVVTRMFVRLALTGRTFLALPLRTLHLALELPSFERREALTALLKATRTADPMTVWPGAFVLMVANDLRRALHRQLGMDRRQLVRLVLANLPPLDSAHRRALIHALNSRDDGRSAQRYRWWGRLHRPLRRALLRWLRRRTSLD